MKIFSKYLLYIIAPAVALSPLVALAEIEEIIVTAEKREESVQDISASVTALNEDILERAGINDPTRLGLVVPGMQFGYSGNEARIAIRGARTNAVGISSGRTAEQVVGVFEDGIYLQTAAAVLSNYLDVNRIEVLRGPQGTLYGRNTFAGSINVISNEPDFEQIEGSVKGVIGRYGHTEYKGVLNLPIYDNLAVRLAMGSEIHDGYIQNSYIDGPSDDLHDQDTQVWRLSTKWEPTDRVSALFRYSGSQKDVNSSAIWGYTQIGCYQNNRDSNTSTGNSAEATFRSGHCYQPDSDSSVLNDANRPGQATAPNNGRNGIDATQQDEGAFNIARNTPSRATTDSDSFILDVDFDIVAWATLKFIGALNTFETLQYYDTDYSDGSFRSADALNNGFAGYDLDQDNISVETQLISNLGGPFEGVAGLYYFDSESDHGFGFLRSGTYVPYSLSRDMYNSKSYAIFGHGTYSVMEPLRFVGGLRWNRDTRGIEGQQTDGWNELLWKAGAEYDLQDDMMLYFTASTGYRVGGVNGTSLVQAGAPRTYDPETVTAYEIGWKSLLLGNQLVLNAASFFNQYRDMHAQSFVTACVDQARPETCIASEFTENGGEIDAYGLELEASWRPNHMPLFADGTLSIQKSEFGTYNVGQVPGLGNYEGRQDVTQTAGELAGSGLSPQLSYKGWEPALNPTFSASLQLGYMFNLGNGNVVTPIIQTTYTGEYWSHDINVPGSEQESHTRTDLRLIWANEELGFEAEAFVLNVEDEEVLTRSVVFNVGQVATPVASIQANYADPRVFGFGLRYKF